MEILPVCGLPRARRGDAVQLAYGERPDGSIVHISALPSGLACDCTCPGCGARLVARKGDLKEHHFGHYRTDQCRHAVESALHKLAKQVLDARRELLLPEVCGRVGPRTLVTHAAELHQFDDAILEHHLDTIVPDVIVRKGSHRLLVEMYVTHRCDAKKVERIRTLGLSCLEIDLRRLSRNASQEQVVEALLSSARRYWLHNPKIERATQRLDAEIAREAALATAAEERAARQKEQRIDALAVEIKRLTPPKIASADPNGDTVRAVRSLGFGDNIGLTLVGDIWFTSSAPVWQATIIQRFLIGLLEQRRASYTTFTSVQVLNDLKALGVVRTDGPSYFDGETERALNARLPGFRTPLRVVEAFLGQLECDGVLREYRHAWSITDSAQPRWADRKRRSEERDRHEQMLRSSLGSILRKIPEDEQEGFSAEVWWSTPDDVLDISFEAALAQDDRRLSELSHRLYLIEAMFVRNGAIVDEDFGLPIGAARKRIIEERRVKAEQERVAAVTKAKAEREDRSYRLRCSARDRLGSTATEWLDTPDTALEMTPVAAAAGSSSGLYEALARLEIAAVAQRVERERDALRASLLRLASQMRRPEHARVFLTTPNGNWRNQHPIEQCFDAKSFEAVKRMMMQVAG